MAAAIEIRALERRFGDALAVAGIDLEVAEGEIYGFLGPNGAGKTTTVRMLCTLLRPTGGNAIVAGHDVVADSAAVRRSIGVALQEAALDPLMTGRELMRLQATLHGLARADGRERAERLLDRVGLVDAADRRVGTYSGGMRRRLDLATALVHEPRVLFLDEPTTGLDPVSRLTIWEEVRKLNDEGTTVFLTTQYLEEADQLADQIVVIDKGKVIAAGTPTQLKDQAGAASVVVTLTHSADVRHAEELLRSCSTEVHVEDASRRLTAKAGGLGDMTTMAKVFQDSGIAIDDLGLKRPSLDDVFLHLTGHRAEVDDGDEAAGHDAELEGVS